MRELQKKGDPYTLTLPEINSLLSVSDDVTLWKLERLGFLREGNSLGEVRALFRLWNALTPGQIKKLLSPTGLGLKQLTVAQRELATLDGPGRQPIISDRTLSERLGGDLTIRVRKDAGRLAVRYETPERPFSTKMVDPRLRASTDSLEVCRVSLNEDSESGKPAE